MTSVKYRISWVYLSRLYWIEFEDCIFIFLPCQKQLTYIPLPGNDGLHPGVLQECVPGNTCINLHDTGPQVLTVETSSHVAPPTLACTATDRFLGWLVLPVTSGALNLSIWLSRWDKPYHIKENLYPHTYILWEFSWLLTGQTAFCLLFQ